MFCFIIQKPFLFSGFFFVPVNDAHNYLLILVFVVLMRVAVLNSHTNYGGIIAISQQLLISAICSPVPIQIRALFANTWKYHDLLLLMCLFSKQLLQMTIGSTIYATNLDYTKIIDSYLNRLPNPLPLPQYV